MITWSPGPGALCTDVSDVDELTKEMSLVSQPADWRTLTDHYGGMTIRSSSRFPRSR
jgi:hypothetical protein